MCFERINPDFWNFVFLHLKDDPTLLRLKFANKSDIDYKFAIDQIEARQKVKSKLPSFLLNTNFLFPSVISCEQCTNEFVAAFKATIFKGKHNSICDLTGGLGIDSMSFANCVDRVTYVERFNDYCRVAKHNFNLLKHNNIDIVNAYCEEFINLDVKFDAIYIDPARRGGFNQRVYAFADCEPNVVALLDRMFEITDHIYIKASPMADISFSVKELKFVSDVFVISYKNECKELLFKLIKGVDVSDINISCIDLYDSKTDKFSFKLSQESDVKEMEYSAPLSYLYEPSAAILKAGAFKVLTTIFDVNKIALNSHIYTSDNYIENFPGRKFKVERVLAFSGKEIKFIEKNLDKANITTRNFPLKPEDLRKRLKIMDGGDKYIFATTDCFNKRILVLCSRA